MANLQHRKGEKTRQTTAVTGLEELHVLSDLPVGLARDAGNKCQSNAQPFLGKVRKVCAGKLNHGCTDAELS